MRPRQNGHPLVKIGISCQPAVRLHELKAKPITVYYCGVGAARRIERRLHEHFAGDRLPGTEWFWPTEALLREMRGEGAILEVAR